MFLILSYSHTSCLINLVWGPVVRWNRWNVTRTGNSSTDTQSPWDFYLEKIVCKMRLRQRSCVWYKLTTGIIGMLLVERCLAFEIKSALFLHEITLQRKWNSYKSWMFKQRAWPRIHAPNAQRQTVARKFLSVLVPWESDELYKIKINTEHEITPEIKD